MVTVLPTPAAVVAAAADLFAVLAHAAVAERDRFVVCLSGGSTARALHAALLARTDLPWAQTWVFWGDERPVPARHADSNVGAGYRTLLDRVDVPADQVFPVDGGLPPATAARRYEEELRAFFGTRPPRFDLVLLGLGPDAHTASLFPGTDALAAHDRWVAAPYVEKLGSHRITLTAPLINQARHVVFIAYGAEKADAFRHVRNGPDDPTRYPAQLIKPTHGFTHWLVDAALAGNE